MTCCAATRCRTPITRGMIFCPDHWDAIPARTRRAIQGAWRARDMQAYEQAFDAARNHLDLADGVFEDVLAPPPPRWIVPQHLGVAR